jgi:acyl-CoA hydrolase|tara:strand:- start:503 stop:964 length:462 start_codon:yes stop_codon:yes gene_type:complete
MKKVSESIVVMHELVLPNDTNVLGNVLGGRVMHLIDICAAMSAYKHARSPVVTASIDHLNFLTPAKKGDILILKSSVNYVSTTSMEIGVRVESENTISGKIKHTASAHLTFVALDEKRRPKKIGKIEAVTEIEKNRYNAAKKRVENRKKGLSK